MGYYNELNQALIYMTYNTHHFTPSVEFNWTRSTRQAANCAVFQIKTYDLFFVYLINAMAQAHIAIYI
jgi:hypothetical protein